jgi:hypothetical protein
VLLLECLLERVHVFDGPQAFHGSNFVPVGLDREHQARANGLAVEEDGARATGAVLAAGVRPRQPEVLTDEVEQELAVLGVRAPLLAVDRDVHLVHLHPTPLERRLDLGERPAHRRRDEHAPVVRRDERVGRRLRRLGGVEQGDPHARPSA